MPDGFKAHQYRHAADGKAQEKTGCIETGFGNCHWESLDWAE
jgi:hypothetical protein